MSEFTYLFHGGLSAGSAEEMQQHMQKWLVWRKDMVEKGHFKDGRPLEKGGKVVTGKGVTDGPFAESKDLVGGFILIEAASLEQAVELSKGCPILEVGGTVEVRTVAKMNP